MLRFILRVRRTNQDSFDPILNHIRTILLNNGFGATQFVALSLQWLITSRGPH